MTECEAFGLMRIAEASGLPGSAERLQATALIGSMLADICGDRPRDALVDGALANVAVTLADRLVDDRPELGVRAAALLSPEAMIARLESPGSPSHSLASPDAGPLAPFCALWDEILVRVGGRLAGQAEQIDYIGSLLALMHESEVGAGADRMPAKSLPIEFVGAVAGCEPGSPEMAVYRELGLLLALADDWNDLAGDIVRFHANHFVSAHDRAMPHLTGSIRRIARPVKLRHEAAGALHERMERTLAAARAAGPTAYSKTHAFLAEIFAFPGDDALAPG